MRFGFVAGGVTEGAAAPRAGCGASRALFRGSLGFSPRASAAFAGFGQEDGVVERRLGDVIAPGHARLQFARVARQQDGKAERRRLEGAHQRPLSRCVVRRRCPARARPVSIPSLPRWASSCSFGGFFLRRLRSRRCGEAAGGAGFATRTEIAGQIPVRRAVPARTSRARSGSRSGCGPTRSRRRSRRGAPAPRQGKPVSASPPADPSECGPVHWRLRLACPYGKSFTRTVAPRPAIAIRA